MDLRAGLITALLLFLKAISHCSPSNFNKQSHAHVIVLLKSLQRILFALRIGQEESYYHDLEP